MSSYMECLCPVLKLQSSNFKNKMINVSLLIVFSTENWPLGWIIHEKQDERSTTSDQNLWNKHIQETIIGAFYTFLYLS